MVSALTLLTLVATSVSAFAPVAALEKRAPGNYQLHPPSDTYGRCLGVNAQSVANGATLSLQTCNTADFLTVFEFVPQQAGLVRLAGTSFCLDSGLGFNEFKLWSCLPDVPQQQWFFTADKHLAVFSKTTCATYSGLGCSRIYCFPGTVPCSSDSWQQWDITEATPPPPPTVKGVTIHPNGNTTLCFVPAGPDVHTQVDGTPVVIGECLYSTRYFGIQLWEVPAKNTFGRIKMRDTNLCLDAGTTPLQNGRALKLWTCYANLYQQTFYRTEDDHLAVYQDSQCVDLRKEDGRILQTWQCAGGNPQQLFTTGTGY